MVGAAVCGPASSICAVQLVGRVGQLAPVPQRRHISESRRRLAPVQVRQVDGRIGEPAVREAVVLVPSHGTTSSVDPRFVLDHADH